MRRLFRRSLSLTVAATFIVAVVSGLTATLPAAAAPADRTDTMDPSDSHNQRPGQPPGSEQGVFATFCRYSHQAADDPIVFPGQPGRSHLHTFFGNTTTNASSTYDSLRAGSSTCRTAGDASAYWAPALTQNGVEIQPLSMKVYYRTGHHDPSSVQPFPPGFRMIAGNQAATQAQGLRTTFWHCRGLQGPEAGPDVRPSETPPTCPADAPLTLHIRFPECWDGVSVDSPNHQSHMAYGQAGRCPASHPTVLPSLAAIVHYPITGEPGSVTLASGSQFSGHADFFNAWEQPVLARHVSECLNANIHCGVRR